MHMRIINLIEDTQGEPNCFYEHGLSFYIETEHHKLLLDTGATDKFLHNAKVLGIDLKQVDTVILSHGHYDHAGGILAFTKVNPDAKIYMRRMAGEDYFHVKEDGERYIGIDKNILTLSQLVLVDAGIKIDEELTLFTNITGRRLWAKSNLMLKKKRNHTFVQDIFDHEQCLVVRQKGKKILLSGCAHNGILNILDTYKENYNCFPDLVISGFHMMQKAGYSNVDIKEIQETARELAETKAVFYSGHCTGKEAFAIMKEIMGEQLREIHSGETMI